MASNRLKVPELFPQPKIIEALEGESDLSIDVRLVTNNVFPLQRKAIRSILSNAGVRVVANKKKYVVIVSVDSPDKFDLSQVKPDCVKDYYELTIQDSEIIIHAPEQDGTVWAAQTAAALFRLFLKGQTFPNLIIKDWPVLSTRGVFIENKWGTDRMTINDWMKAIDNISALKFNTLGIGLYGCWGNCRFEGPNAPTEFLMTKIHGHEELKTVHTLKWYSPESEKWEKESYLPYMYEKDDLLPELISYANERGITVVPHFNSFGHNVYIARNLPELSAKDAEGNATGVGYCLTSPKTREFIEHTYTSIIEKYFRSNMEYFHVQLDEVWPDNPWPDDPLKVGQPWCQCDECKKHTNEENIEDYIIWLVKMLLSKGIQKVVLWNDQLTRHMNLLNKAFAKRLEAEGIKDKIILHWWCYSNGKPYDNNNAAIGKKLGIAGWVAPMFCYYNWDIYCWKLPNVDMMMRMCEHDKADGAVAYSIYDPCNLDHAALLSMYAWESIGKNKLDGAHLIWANTRFGENGEKYVKAVDNLQIAAQLPNYQKCTPYIYTYAFANKPWPRQYPGEALGALEASADAMDELKKANTLATEAEAIFAELLEMPGLVESDIACLASLRGEAARIQAFSEIFIYLLELREKLSNGMVMKSMVTSTGNALDSFIAHIAVVEKYKASWIVPASLHGLGLMVAFLEQFKEDLKKHAARKQAKLLKWFV